MFFSSKQAFYRNSEGELLFQFFNCFCRKIPETRWYIVIPKVKEEQFKKVSFIAITLFILFYGIDVYLDYFLPLENKILFYLPLAGVFSVLMGLSFYISQFKYKKYSIQDIILDRDPPLMWVFYLPLLTFVVSLDFLYLLFE